MERDLLYAYQGLKDTTKESEPVEDPTPASIHQGASNLHSDEDMEDKIKLLDPRVQKLIRTYLGVFGELLPPASCDKLVQMDLKLKPEFVGHRIRRRPYPAPNEQADEIERQIQECIDAGRVLEYKDWDYPPHCSPCFLVAKPGSTAKRLVEYALPRALFYFDLSKKENQCVDQLSRPTTKVYDFPKLHYQKVHAVGRFAQVRQTIWFRSLFCL